jgi:hypothetical protein
MRALPIVIALAMLLSGCSPAVYLNLYNATDDTLTIARAQFRPIITVPPHSAADLPLGYQVGEHVVIHSSRHIWTYSPGLLFPPQSMYQHHTMVMRAFAKIDRGGAISMIVPAGASQPRGFPVKPQKT